MYLEKLEIQGFKSFANKTTLEFGQGITAIVGPNGSGKSNVADAIRWVLGEQSLKLIRGKKAEDVIFAGSDRKTKLGAAEVSLYLNNEDNAAPIDFSELVITRRVYRDGTGEYLVNKRSVRLQDIHLLLAKANFGQRTYSVIGQGMVDAILMTSPQERKHFFDEAAGVRQFQLKREQTVSKLDRTRENLSQAEVLMQEIEPRLRSLTRQVKRLERRAEVEAQLIELQTKYYRGSLQHLRAQLQSAQSQLESFEGQRTSRDQTVQQLNQKLSKLEQEQTRSEAFATLQRQFEQVQSEKSVLLAEEAVLKGQRESAFREQGKGNVLWLEKQLSAVRQQRTDIESELSHLKQSLETEAARVASLETAATDAQQAYAAHEAEFNKASEAMQREAVSMPEIQREFQEFLAVQQAFVNELKSATSMETLAGLQKKIDELDSRAKRFAEKLERVGRNVEPQRIMTLQNQMRQVLLARDTAAKQANDLQLLVSVRQEKVSLLTAGIERLRGEQERLERELARTGAETQEAMSATLRSQAAALSKKIAEVDERLAGITKQMKQFNESESAKRDELFRLQRELRTAQDALNEVSAKCNEIRVETARLETRLQDIEKEIREEVKEPAWPLIFDKAEATAVPSPEAGEEIIRIKHQLALIGGIDEGVETEYKATDERYTFLKTQYDDLIKASGQLEQGIEELDRTIKERFDEAFEKISVEFSAFFKTLFRGGMAKLILVREELKDEAEEEMDEDESDDEDEDDEKSKPPGKGEKVITGIEIQATPPGKRLKGIAMLSGGERALTSIALICAIISNNPMPFAVLDEVDAALDEANSQRFAEILSKLAHKTQFVTITHNRATMEKSRILYGVTMGDDGVSKLLSVKLEQAEEVIKKYGNR